MKKIIKFLAITLSAFILFGCPKTSDSLNNQTDSSDTQPESESPDTNHEIKNETFKEISVFNPTENTVKLVAEPKARSLIPESRAAATEICTVKSKEKKEVKIGSEHDYYFTDEVNIKIADLSKSDNEDYMPVYLELNEPNEGKEYLLLNQYKTDTILENFTRYPQNGENFETYNLLLYEVIAADDLDSYKYDENTYIRIYPSANYWIDSEGYASNKLGTKITFNQDFKNNFAPLSNSWVAWGWSTKNTEFDMWFCHRVVSYILHAKDGNSYGVKTNITEQASIKTTIQAVYSENPNWGESWTVELPSTENTKWKVTEIWFYSTQKLYYSSSFNSKKAELEKKLQEKIPGCVLILSPKDREKYDGWMPQNCKYALCMRLESKNCRVQNVWCENIETELLKEVYAIMLADANKFILNY